MKFVNPAFLFALFSLAIPIIIHLFNFRRFKRVYFTNVRFLKEVKQDTQSRNRLKHLIVLACRCLALAFLVFAFAQPYVPAPNQKQLAGDKVISVYIDNSFSMEATGKSGTLLDEAKTSAREIAMHYKPTDRFQLLTNDFEGRHQRLVNREEFLGLVDEVKPSPAVRKLSEVVTRQRDVLSSAEGIVAANRQAYLLSDYQQSVTDFTAIKTDTNIRYRTVPLLAQNRNNIYVDSCWFVSPVHRINEQEALHVRIRSRADQRYDNVPMRLYINNQAKTPASFSIDPNGVTDTVMYFTMREPGLQQCRVEITDAPVTFDDKFYLSFEVLKQIPVMSIVPSGLTVSTGFVTNWSADLAAPSDYLGSLFGRDSLFQYTVTAEDKIDYASFSTYRMIVLNGLKTIPSGLAQELRKFTENGGSLFIFPGETMDGQSYRDFLGAMNCNTYEQLDTVNTVADYINYDHRIYTGVFEKKGGNLDLPVALGHYRISKTTRTRQDELIRLRNGDLFAGSTAFGKGMVYLCSVPLNGEWTNFGQHAVFVPTLYQAALFSQPQAKMYHTIGSDETIDLPKTITSTDNVFHIKNAEKNFDAIPGVTNDDAGTRLDVHRQVTEPGNYVIATNTGAVGGTAFNYDRKESDLRTYSPEEIKKSCEGAGLTNFSLIDSGGKGLTAALSEIDLGKKFWKTCLIIALIFLLAETLVLRFWPSKIRRSGSETTQPVTN